MNSEAVKVVERASCMSTASAKFGGTSTGLAEQGPRREESARYHVFTPDILLQKHDIRCRTKY
jgi:hypothetical protein